MIGRYRESVRWILVPTEGDKPGTLARDVCKAFISAFGDGAAETRDRSGCGGSCYVFGLIGSG